MTTKRCNTFLLICAFVVGVGCSQPSSGYNIQRIDNALLVFLVMEDTSKIVEAKIDNHNLNIKIEKDGEIVETVITLKKKSFFSLVEADETIKVHGINRINRYGVVHLTVKSPYIVDLSIIPMSDDQKTATEKKRPFDNSTLIDR